MGLGSILLGLASPAASILVLDKPPAFVTPPKYPVTALRNEISGPVRVRLTVRPNGKVLDCAIIASSGYFGLDEGSCVTLKKDAAFAPLSGKTNRQFEMRINWSVGGYGSIPDALRILSTRLSGLREGQSIPPKIVLGACQQQDGFRWCDGAPPPAYLKPEIPSGGKLRLAIAEAGAAVIGFDLEFDSSMMVAAERDIIYFHGPACFFEKRPEMRGWVAGQSYMALVAGKIIAGRPDMSPLLGKVARTCPPLTGR